MSLAGNLEDLGLGEILQIVSLSRKTGVLSLDSRGRNGSVFFRNGQVVSACSSDYRQSLGEVLLQKGVIDLGVLRKALAIRQEQGNRELLVDILVKNFSVSREIIEDIAREQIESIVFPFFAWSEGVYNFTSQNDSSIVDAAKLNPLQFVLDQGLNPQFLVLDGTRILDEKRNVAGAGASTQIFDEVSPGPAFYSADPDHASSSVSAAQPMIVVVDDDGPTLKAIANELSENGFAVYPMSSSQETLVKVDTLLRGGDCPVVLIDLIMPKMDGSGVLGGIELLELLQNKSTSLHVIVLSDYHHADAEKKVHEMGCHFMMKPRRIEIGNPGIRQGFITQLLDEIRCKSELDACDDRQDHYNLGDELRIEMGDEKDARGFEDSTGQRAGFSLLKGMLEELNNSGLQSGVLLLVLRFASEFFNRAIVFTITDGIISGSGQFGIGGAKKSGDEQVRAINFPLEEDSIFKDSLNTGQSLVFKPEMTAVDRYFFEHLGGGVPDEVFVGPIVSQSRVTGFLYGDNLPDRHAIGDVELLAIFLSQAGIAMEKYCSAECQSQERATV